MKRDALVQFVGSAGDYRSSNKAVRALIHLQFEMPDLVESKAPIRYFAAEISRNKKVINKGGRRIEQVVAIGERVVNQQGSDVDGAALGDAYTAVLPIIATFSRPATTDTDSKTRTLSIKRRKNHGKSQNLSHNQLSWVGIRIRFQF